MSILSVRPARGHKVLLLAAACAAVLASSAARADLPPPDGQKFVDFSFTVTGVSKAPDQVLFAFPCSDSNGVPVAKLTLVNEGKPVGVGRRGGGCELYATTKARYDEWAKTYTPTGSVQDPPAEAFAKASTKCTGGPTPSFVLPSSDSRSKVEEALEVASLTATECVIRSKSTPSNAATATSSAPPAKKSGCSAAGGPSGALPWLLALVVPVIGAGARRLRRRS